MTISSAVARADYPGAGSVGPFAYPFKVNTTGEIAVIRRASTGVETTLAYPADYAVTGIGDGAGGTVTLTTALAVGEHLTIRRFPAVIQSADIRNQGAYQPSTLEDALDRLVMIDQLHRDAIDRSPKLIPSLDPDDYNLLIPAPEAGKALVLRTDGEGFEWRTLTDASVALPGNGRSVASLSDYLDHNKVFNVKDYATPQAAITAASASGGVVWFPTGDYTVTSAMTVAGSKVTIRGDGDATHLTATMSDPVFISSAHDDVVIQDMKITGAHAGGVYLTGGHRCRIENLTIQGATVNNAHSACAGIYVEDVDDMTITRNRLSGNGSATGEAHGDIVCNTGTYQITNSRITFNSCASTLVNINICCFDPRNVLIEGNVCTGAVESAVSATRQGYGILVYNTVTVSGTLVGECRILGNHVHDVRGCGIFNQSIRDSVVANNLVRNSGAGQTDGTLCVAGIVIEGDGQTCTGNRVYASSKDGIDVSSCTNSTCTGNNVSGSGKNGIGIRGVCSDVVIADNLVKDTNNGNAIGMWSDTAAVRLKVADNKIRTQVTPGVGYAISTTASTANWTITNNDVSGYSVDSEFSILGSTHTRLGNRRTTAAATNGRAVLVAGTVTVSTAEVITADSIILTRVVTGGTVGHLTVGTITSGTSFVINSSSGTDTSTIYWEIRH